MYMLNAHQQGKEEYQQCFSYASSLFFYILGCKMCQIQFAFFSKRIVIRFLFYCTSEFYHLDWTCF